MQRSRAKNQAAEEETGRWGGGGKGTSSAKWTSAHWHSRPWRWASYRYQAGPTVPGARRSRPAALPWQSTCRRPGAAAVNVFFDGDAGDVTDKKEDGMHVFERVVGMVRLRTRGQHTVSVSPCAHDDTQDFVFVRPCPPTSAPAPPTTPKRRCRRCHG